MTGDVLLYDGDCGFCTRCAAWLSARASSLDVRPMQSVDLGPLGVDAERALREVPFVRAAGDVVYGAAAIAESLARCGGALRVLGSVLRKPLALRVAHPVYALVARNRHRMPGGTAACALSPSRRVEGDSSRRSHSKPRRAPRRRSPRGRDCGEEIRRGSG